MASARLEESVGSVLAYLAGSEEAWILFTGRPVKSLVEQSLAVIAERVGYRDDDENVNLVCDLLKQAAELLEFRNAIVHAVWVDDAWDFAPDRSFPWSINSDVERRFYPARPRMNRGHSQMWVTASDVRELARRLSILDKELIDAVARAERLSGFWAQVPKRTDWHIWDGRDSD